MESIKEKIKNAYSSGEYQKAKELQIKLDEFYYGTKK
jgi:hypothetical protein